MTRQEKRLRWLQERNALTTEQLAELVILSLDRMNSAEKAEVRKHLDNGFRRAIFTDADREFLREGRIKL